MASFIITLIIFAVIFFRAYKKSKAQKEAFAKHQKQNTYGNPTPSGTAHRRTVERPREDILTRSKKNVAEDFGNTSSDAGKIRQTKERLLKKQQEATATYDASNVSKPSPTPVPVPPEKKDISYPSDSDELMKIVQDLIVKGYEPKMTFERDFISEGIDLLNNYYQ